MPRPKNYQLIKGKLYTIWIDGIETVKYRTGKCGKCKGYVQVATVDDTTEKVRTRVPVAHFCKRCKIVYPFKKKEIFTS